MYWRLVWPKEELNNYWLFMVFKSSSYHWHIGLKLAFCSVSHHVVDGFFLHFHAIVENGQRTSHSDFGGDLVQGWDPVFPNPGIFELDFPKSE